MIDGYPDIPAAGSLMSKILILFVHGLAGSRGSWGDFESLIKQDEELKPRVDVAFFVYPTGLVRFPWSDKYLNPQDVADGLTTEIGVKHAQYKKILLVCHSMGGLVAKRSIIDELLRRHELQISGVVFFATPHKGSELAAVATNLSAEHRQTKAIRPDTEFLRVLNKEWLEQGCEAKVDATYVAAGKDACVTKNSAEGPQTSRRDIDVLKGHIDIVKPTSSGDLAFLIVKAAAKRVIYDKNADYAKLLDAINNGDSHSAEHLVATKGRSWIERQDSDRAIDVLERVVKRFDATSAEVIWSKYLLVIARLFRSGDTSSTAIDDDLIRESEALRLAPLLLAERMELTRKRGDRELAIQIYSDVARQLAENRSPRSAGEAYAIATSHFLVANLMRYGGRYADAQSSIEVARKIFVPTIVSHQTELAHCQYALEVCRSMTGLMQEDRTLLMGGSEFRPFAEALLLLAKSHSEWTQARLAEAAESAEDAANGFEAIGYRPYAVRAKRLFGLLEVWRKLDWGASVESAVTTSSSADGSILRALLGVAGSEGTIHDQFNKLRPSNALGLLQFASARNDNWTKDIGGFALPPVLERTDRGLRWITHRASSLHDADRILRDKLDVPARLAVPLVAD
nr:alpha/beta fold hydrolase [Bradyrhizobium elkanii]